MSRVYTLVLCVIMVAGANLCQSQCTIDSANTTAGFTPSTPAVISPGVAYSQVVQVYVPANDGSYIVDSLQFDSIGGVPNGITYTIQPASGYLPGGSNGVICFAGTTNDSVGLYPLSFYGNIYTNVGTIPLNTLATLIHGFGYKFRIETMPVAMFVVDSPSCASDSVRFTDLSGGYPTKWAWSFTGGSPATSTLQYPAIFYDSAGTFPVTLIAKNSIGNDTITQNITVNPAVNGTVATTPADGDSASANGSAIAVLSGGTPPFAYLWSNNATTDTMSGVVTGSYWVQVTDSKGCQYANDNVEISFINDILQLSASQEVKIYPNPATTELNLVWSQTPNAQVSVIDLYGRVISNYQTAGEMKSVLDIHTIAAGDYVLRITDKTTNQQQGMLFSKF